MEGLASSFKDYVKQKNCAGVSSIQDVNDQYDYVDQYAGGLADSNKVSCGQSGKYNELKDKYLKYYSHYREADVAQAMCECCKSASGGTWENFYSLMESKGFYRKF